MSAVRLAPLDARSVNVHGRRSAGPENSPWRLSAMFQTRMRAEKIKPVFEGMEKKIGAVPNVFRAMAHNPEMLEAFLALNATLAQDQARRQAARAGLHQDLGAQRLRLLPASPSRARQEGRAERPAGRRDRPVRDQRRLRRPPARRDALRRGGDPAHQRRRRRSYDRLKQKLGDREIVELAMTVGIANFTNRVTETLRLELP